MKNRTKAVVEAVSAATIFMGAYFLLRKPTPTLPVSPPAPAQPSPGQPLNLGITPTSPVPQLAGLFPNLAVGDLVSINPVAANLPEPLRSLPVAIGTVDLILSDKTLISVKVLSVGTVAPFSGTIPRSAITAVLPKLPSLTALPTAASVSSAVSSLSNLVPHL